MADISYNEFTRPFTGSPASNYDILSNQDMGRPFAIGFDHENCREPESFTYGGNMGGDVIHEEMPDAISIPAPHEDY